MIQISEEEFAEMKRLADLGKGLDSPATRQQPVPTGDGADITELVLRDFEERRLVGIQRYGRPLRAFNGRDALVDAYQECMDQVVYLRQRIEEEAATSKSKPTAEDEEAHFDAWWRAHSEWIDHTCDRDLARQAFDRGVAWGRGEQVE